jgi:FkbM family methyltransferase
MQIPPKALALITAMMCGGVYVMKPGMLATYEAEVSAAENARLEAQREDGVLEPPPRVASDLISDTGAKVPEETGAVVPILSLSPDPARPKRLVFIDLGANCGNSYKRLKNRKFLDSPDWEIWLWEANPQMIKWYLTDLAKTDTRIRVVDNAAWVEEKVMQFFLTRGQEDVTEIQQFKAHKCKGGSHYQPSGASSLFSGKGDGGSHDAARRGSKYIAGKPVDVQAVDFNKWMQDLKLQVQDHVVLKIDIEGAEIPLLKHMLEAGNEICLVDHFFIEWHSWLLAEGSARKETEVFENDLINKTITRKCGATPEFGGWH